MNIPTASELGISAKHRRAIMVEHHFRFLISLARQTASESAVTQATETIESTTLEMVGGESAAQDLRDHLSRQSDRYTARAAEYLRRRASGQSAASATAYDRQAGFALHLR